MGAESPMQRLKREMAEAAAAARRAGRGDTIYHFGDGALFVGGDLTMGGGTMGRGIRAEQRKCRQLIAEIDVELDGLTAAELRRILDRIRPPVAGGGEAG